MAPGSVEEHSSVRRGGAVLPQRVVLHAPRAGACIRASVASGG